MVTRSLAALLILVSSTFAVTIDRIAVVVGNSIVKDSDISRDIRVTDFLNEKPLDLSERARKATASRLIDQIFIRKEIELGAYPVATQSQADSELEKIVHERFHSDAALQDRLQRYGITGPDLRSHFLWQLTVLRFIDARFKPAVYVSDKDVEQYYREHVADFRRQSPQRSSLNDVRSQIVDTITAERVNKLFFSWLDDQRKQSKIKFLEPALQ